MIKNASTRKNLFIHASIWIIFILYWNLISFNYNKSLTIVKYGPVSFQARTSQEIGSGKPATLWFKMEGEISTFTTVNWNGEDLVTTVNSKKSLVTASLPDRLSSQTGTHRVLVINKDSNLVSNEALFTITR